MKLIFYLCSPVNNTCFYKHCQDCGQGGASAGCSTLSRAAGVAAQGSDADERQEQEQEEQRSRSSVLLPTSSNHAGASQSAGGAAGIAEKRSAVCVGEQGHAPQVEKAREDASGSGAKRCRDVPCEGLRVFDDEHVLRSATELGGAWQKVVDGQIKLNDPRGSCRVCRKKTSYWCRKCSVIPTIAGSKKKIVYLCAPQKSLCYYTHCNDAAAGGKNAADQPALES